MDKETTTKKAKPKKVDLGQKIVEAYVQHVLENGKAPISIYKFCKNIKISEEDFYNHFSSFDGVKNHIWKTFFDECIHIIQNDPVYKEYSVREKLLSFYYTWIEVLKKRRSYILQSTQHYENRVQLGTPAEFRSFRKAFVHHMGEIVQEGLETGEIAERPFVTDRYHEALWSQAVFVLWYWLKDQSKGFENTDAAIEKAVNLTFDLIGSGPIDTFIDFAKFVFQSQKDRS